MSYISFHFGEDETFEVRGRERALMGLYVEELAAGAGGLLSGMGQKWSDLNAAQIYGAFLGLTERQIECPRQGLAEDLVRSLSATGDRREVFSWKGKEISSWSLALNTVLAIGSDPIRLCAKIHGTCEIQGFFEGEDRGWFADLIEEGLEDGVFRAFMGWPELVEQLRVTSDHPVVMSFSATDGFPDPPDDWRPGLGPGLVNGEEWDSRSEAWYDLSNRERFDLAMAEVRTRKGNLPISPKTLRAYRFTHELSLLDLRHQDIEKIERKLGLWVEQEAEVDG